MKVQRRRRDFIDYEVQGAIARRMAWHWVLFVAAVALLGFALKWCGQPDAPLASHAVEAWWTYGPLFIVLVCLAPIFMFDAVKLSNRFTGPMVRVRRAARALAAGETPKPIRVRGSDFWKDLASDLNRVIDRFADGRRDA